MKTTMFFTALFIFLIGGIMISRQPSAEAQPATGNSAPDVEAKFDAKIERVENKLQVAESIKPPPVKATTLKRNNQKKRKGAILPCFVDYHQGRSGSLPGAGNLLRRYRSC